MLHDLLGEDISVYAFEPIPETYEILDLNVQSLSTQKIYTLPFGLSDANKVAEFSYSSGGSALSSIYPYDGAEQRMIKRAFIRTLNYLPKNAPLFLKLLNKMPGQVLNFVLSHMAKKAFDFKQVTCQLKTVSELMAELNISAIDLLKIDVEKSELDVIHGIEDRDWEKIKQIIIEVHDISDRISVLTQILYSHGFKQVHVEQEVELIGTNIHCIYALK
ncbi:FkbM family methyltransferase [Acaryochloris sp. CCMEE 5410]|uniref:FkbM family methyltransferase n=1 Tax=Acaryochloris sp. CCMEE 5410 TaxID=310037 RepID=UPI0021D1AA03|nr:FkbM family methyltransferase [Acaryochloris sp. CCMEE 5410]KAI9134508.1 FkbM family methyltransferase [Acaryochloris sp. CCMEE 5410]